MNTKISNEELSAICLELSLLMRAGVGVSDALCLLAEENAEYREMLSGMMEQTDMGATLSTVMRDTGRFPAYLCGLVEVGERTGRTEEALSALANYYEERVRTGRRVRSALLYPAVMLALMLVVIGVLLVKVLPIFDDVYASLGGRLTGAAGSGDARCVGNPCDCGGLRSIVLACGIPADKGCVFLGKTFRR